jgi:hypothetical protein
MFSRPFQPVDSRTVGGKPVVRLNRDFEPMKINTVDKPDSYRPNSFVGYWSNLVSDVSEPITRAPFFYNDKSNSNQAEIDPRRRLPNGKIIGQRRTQYCHPPEILMNWGKPEHDDASDASWLSYWDEEAGASYYYNEVTGEATWIPPDQPTD